MDTPSSDGGYYDFIYGPREPDSKSDNQNSNYGNAKRPINFPSLNRGGYYDFAFGRHNDNLDNDEDTDMSNYVKNDYQRGLLQDMFGVLNSYATSGDEKVVSPIETTLGMAKSMISPGAHRWW